MDIVSWINGWWQQVSGTTAQGLQITVVGMSLVFFTLGLIILVLALLTRLPGLRVKQNPSQQAQSPSPTLQSESTPDRTTTLSSTATDAEWAQVAAIAVALIRSQRPTGQRVRTSTTASKWKQYGRAHQLGL